MVAVALVTIVVGGFTAAVLIGGSVEGSIRQEFARQADATARLVESQLNDDRVGRSLAETLIVVRAVGGHDFVEASFVGPGGRVNDLADGAVLIPQIPGGASSLRTGIRFDAVVGETNVAVFAAPFRVAARGTVVVAIGTSLDLVPWRGVVARFALGILVAVVLAAALAAWLSRSMLRRLDGLRSAARSLAAGDPVARAPIEGADEIAEVATAFNEMADDLVESRRREREFLASVGHDLRTPLTTIAGYAEALADGRILPEDLERVAAVLGTQSARLQRLVEDLMLLSRLEAREFGLRPERVDLAGHLKGVADTFRDRADAARVMLGFEAGDFPAVLVDPDRVGQITTNLLENALRYTPEAGSVRLAVGGDASWVRISVADSGPGIDPEDLPHIFERLYVTRRYRPVRPEGSGLGLAIVAELVEAMGGTVAVTSTPQAGTTFSVTLPAVPPPPA